MEQDAKIFVAGYTGLVGSSITRRLQAAGFKNLLFRTSEELDLRNQEEVMVFFQQERPAYVFLAAAKVGGIWANNSYPAEFIYDNLVIQTNVIHQAYLTGVKKLLFLGSSCIYPKLCPQPMKEDYLLAGQLEPTNEPYAVAKIAGIKMCQSYNRQYKTRFICLMPTNLYGPGDNFDLMNSHVIAGLMRKCHEAKITGSDQVVVWGTGKAQREFLYVDDLADACLFLMEHYDSGEIINVGTGKDISIKELAQIMAEVVGFQGELVFDARYPDGTPQKLLDVSRINQLGWHFTTSLREGLVKTYEWYKQSLWSREIARPS